MASEFTVETAQLTPEDKGGPRVGVGCTARAKRVGDGLVTIQIRRGDGLFGGETWPDDIRSRVYPVLGGVETLVELATLDFGLVNFDERSYQLRIVADGGADLSVRFALIATEPYALAGVA